jgi:hypothetical protein
MYLICCSGYFLSKNPAVGPAIASENTRHTAITTRYQLQIPRSTGPSHLDIIIMVAKFRPAIKSFAISIKPDDLSIIKNCFRFFAEFQLDNILSAFDKLHCKEKGVFGYYRCPVIGMLNN